MSCACLCLAFEALTGDDQCPEFLTLAEDDLVVAEQYRAMQPLDNGSVGLQTALLMKLSHQPGLIYRFCVVLHAPQLLSGSLQLENPPERFLVLLSNRHYAARPTA